MHESYGKIKYKERAPYSTIKNIRDILFTNDLLFIENSWNCHHNNLWSVNLRHPSLPIFVNGKGVTVEYSLASAYGELMERLQNLAFPSISQSYNDEVELPIKKLISDEPIIYKYILKNFSDEVLKKKEALSSIPFYNQTEQRVTYIPRDFFSYMIGSNGMCAGNSPEEALIQGTCELFERYILKKIYFEQLVCPNIPESILKGFKFYETVLQLLDHGYEVYVKDYSLKGKFPVAGLLLKKGDRARLALGSAPNSEIAIERCITEIFQGVKRGDFDKLLQPLSKNSDRESSIDYFFSQLKTGTGPIPEYLFKDSGDFRSDYLFRSSDLTAKETIKSLIDIVHKEGFHFLYRDTSFLGFPAYHVYIPEMSYVFGMGSNDSEDYSQRFYLKESANKTIFNIENATDDELDIATNFIEYAIKDPSMRSDQKYSTIFNLPVNHKALFGDYDLEQLLTMLYYYKGDYKKAYSCYSSYLESNEVDEPSHSCLKEFLLQLSRGKKLTEIKDILRNSYSEDDLEENYQVLESASENISTIFNLKGCNKECGPCIYRTHCYRDKLDMVRKSLKNAIKNCSIKQGDRING